MDLPALAVAGDPAVYPDGGLQLFSVPLASVKLPKLTWVKELRLEGTSR